jgi:carbon-monoxide dehydrogenase medium subunit
MINPLPRLPQFELVKLDTLESTLQFLIENGDAARPYLGGTDLLVAMRDRRAHPKFLVSLSHLEGFDTLTFDSEIGLTIGAAVNLNQLIASKEIQSHYPVLALAARHVGGYQLRNRATLVGNLCNASPCGDTIGPSILYQGKAIILGPTGMRSVALKDFFIGPGKTALSAGEIVTSIYFPIPPAQHKGTYLCIGRNKLADLAAVAVTVLAHPDDSLPSGFRFRIALSAVAPTGSSGEEAQALLAEQPIHASSFEDAAEIARQNCKPINDIRASESYRRDMVYTLTLRALQQTWQACQP